MADYTVIVDDDDPRIAYTSSWESALADNDAYRGSLHQAVATNSGLTFTFIGGRKVIIRGDFVGDNNALDSATYPIFQMDSQDFLSCSPNPQNDGQFICSTSLPLAITNRTLTMFVNPNVNIQQFHIDYIRYGSSSLASQAADRTTVFVQSPNVTTPGLSFLGNWQELRSLGDANDIENAMETSTTSSKATYNFVGDSFAWWSCCMPPSTSSNAANVTFSIDAGKAVALQIDERFIQGPSCKDERVLFQTLAGQLQPGNHTVEVVYSGDTTKMPLTLCALAATPLDFSSLDVQPSGSGPLLSSPFPSAFPGQDHPITTSTIGGIVAGMVPIIVLLVSVIRWIKMRAKRRAEERKLSALDAPSLFVFHPVVGFIDVEKRGFTVGDSESIPISANPSNNIPVAPPITSNEHHEDNGGPHSTDNRPGLSRFESRPPSYRTMHSIPI